MRTKSRPTFPICRWISMTASVPNGSATVLTRATSANSMPIRARPTKPRATEKSVQKPCPGRLVLMSARTNGAIQIPTKIPSQAIPRRTALMAPSLQDQRHEHDYSRSPCLTSAVV
jgi:hypothetical protein